MHSHSIDRWHHDHVFLGDGHDRNERRTWLVVGLTAIMMVGEIVSGTLFGSMALLADGWHMATHVGALSIAALAYAYARRHAHAPQYSFGTGKVGDLAAFASAVGLAVVALMIAWDSVWRLLAPIPIRFDQAIAVAVLGLAVNLVSAVVLHGSHDHAHHDHAHHDHAHHDHAHHDHAHHDHDGDRHDGDGHHDHAHQDHNLRAAYVHVLADALTSVLAIVGLFAGRYQGWVWMDPLMGVVGALVIARWSWTLIRDAGSVLLDAVSDRQLAERLRGILESDGDRVTDLHFWRIGPGHNAAVITLITNEPHPPEHYKSLLRFLPTLSHVTIEVHRCDVCQTS